MTQCKTTGETCQMNREEWCDEAAYFDFCVNCGVPSRAMSDEEMKLSKAYGIFSSKFTAAVYGVGSDEYKAAKKSEEEMNREDEEASERLEDWPLIEAPSRDTSVRLSDDHLPTKEFNRGQERGVRSAIKSAVARAHSALDNLPGPCSRDTQIGEFNFLIHREGLAAELLLLAGELLIENAEIIGRGAVASESDSHRDDELLIAAATNRLEAHVRRRTAAPKGRGDNS